MSLHEEPDVPVAIVAADSSGIERSAEQRAAGEDQVRQEEQGV